MATLTISQEGVFSRVNSIDQCCAYYFLTLKENDYEKFVSRELNHFQSVWVSKYEPSITNDLGGDTMKRLYYLTDDINAAEEASDRLHQEGISDWNLHVLGKDKAELFHHHLHSTTPLQELDIIRSGERGALLGIATGILVTGFVVYFTPLGASLNWLAQAAIVLLFSCFGAWLGGLVGVSTDNYKLRRFRKEIDNGGFLLLVDVSPSERQAVETLLSSFSNIRKAGEDSTIVNPFESPVPQG